MRPTLEPCQAGETEAAFATICHSPDPRAYYRALGSLDCTFPEIARPILLQLVQHCVAERNRPIIVLDVGCSYGVNAALLRHGLPLAHLRERYLTPSMQEVSAEHIGELDRRYFSGWPARKDVRFVGLDAAVGAIAYGRRAGLLEAGLALDLETERLDASARALVARADLIISTSCITCATETTFAKLIAAFPAKRKPWVASFASRVFDYNRIAETLARNGLTTEKIEEATFVQRRFVDDTELHATLRALDELGLDPTGKEAEGLLHAELFVSRPAKAATSAPMSEIVSLTTRTSRSRLPFSRSLIAE